MNSITVDVALHTANGLQYRPVSWPLLLVLQKHKGKGETGPGILCVTRPCTSHLTPWNYMASELARPSRTSELLYCSASVLEDTAYLII
jgi:hypothetical protein